MPRIATRCIACDHDGLDRQSAVLMPFIAQRAFGWTPCEVTEAWGLRDLPRGHALALCSTLHCRHCGLLFLDMRFDDDEMARLYAGYRGPAYEAEREGFEPGYSARNRALLAGDAHIPQVEALLAPGLPPAPAVLDWGGDTGQNTPLRARARLHHVLDISGRPLVAGAVAVTEEGLDEAYDLVVLSNVLEHLPEPLALLQRVAQRMAAMARQVPAVRLYVEVPFEALMQQAEGDPQAWEHKRHWHEHINFFSPAALEQLLRRAGFTLQQQQRIAVPGGAVQLGLVCGLAAP